MQSHAVIFKKKHLLIFSVASRIRIQLNYYSFSISIIYRDKKAKYLDSTLLALLFKNVFIIDSLLLKKLTKKPTDFKR